MMAHFSLRSLASVAIAGTAAFALTACGGGNDERLRTDLAAAQTTTIGVNAFLWRASLETLSFARLTTADSAGGVLITDWYSQPENPNERVSVSVTILDQTLRADALRVNATRQVMQNGQWTEAPVQAATIQKLEDIILTTARDIRRSTVN